MTSWWGEVLLPSTYPAPSPPPAWLAVLALPTELPKPWGTEPNMRKWLHVPAPREAAALGEWVGSCLMAFQRSQIFEVLFQHLPGMLFQHFTDSLTVFPDHIFFFTMCA